MQIITFFDNYYVKVIYSYVSLRFKNNMLVIFQGEKDNNITDFNFLLAVLIIKNSTSNDD